MRNLLLWEHISYSHCYHYFDLTFFLLTIGCIMVACGEVSFTFTLIVAILQIFFRWLTLTLWHFMICFLRLKHSKKLFSWPVYLSNLIFCFDIITFWGTGLLFGWLSFNLFFSNSNSSILYWHLRQVGA